VSLISPDLPSHITCHGLIDPHGSLRANWADVYWLDADAQAAAIPGIDWAAVAPHVLKIREMLTLSHLRVEERLD
jgi:hypothetical protein